MLNYVKWSRNILSATRTVKTGLFTHPSSSYRDKNIEEHSLNLAIDETNEYIKIIEKFSKIKSLPEIPSTFSFSPGWTKYINGHSKQVVYPKDETLIFDVETLVQHNKRPVIAVALSRTAWYTWCSSSFFEENFDPDRPLGIDDLIPFEGKKDRGQLEKKRVLVGHNVSFDRSYVKEQYYPDKGAIRFLDTMSMHIACSGFSKKQQDAINFGDVDLMKSSGLPFKKSDYLWLYAGCRNNLKDVHQFYVRASTPINKDTRNVFIKGSLNDVSDDFQNLMRYCLNDVYATFQTFQKLTEIFLTRFSNPVTMGGMLELSTMYLPINQKWSMFQQECQSECEDSEYILNNLLEKLANEGCEFTEFKEMDPWLYSLDWDLKSMKLNASETKNQTMDDGMDLSSNVFYAVSSEDQCSTIERYKDLAKLDSLPGCGTKSLLPKFVPHLSNYPNWFRNLCMKPQENDWKPGPCLLTAKRQITPLLLRLEWNNSVIHYHKDHWCILDKQSSCNTGNNEEACTGKLPHKDGGDCNVGNPVSFVSNQIAQIGAHDSQLFDRFQKLILRIADWKRNAGKIKFQKPIWLGENGSNLSGAILPIMPYYGSITRLCEHKLWDTEVMDRNLKSYVQVPDGFSFIIVDLGSLQEVVRSIVKRDYLQQAMTILLETRETVLGEKVPRTPLLGSPITRCLERDLSGENFKASKEEWFEASTLVDILNLILVQMSFLVKANGVNARLMVCLRGEMVYIVEDKDRNKAKGLLLAACLNAKKLLADKLKIKDSILDLDVLATDVLIRKSWTKT